MLDRKEKVMRDYKIIVENVLRNHPDARDDDFRLYGWVCKETNPEIMDMPFKKVMWLSNSFDLPSYETITRQRRKLQEQIPELRGKKYKIRQERQSEYKETFGRFYS